MVVSPGIEGLEVSTMGKSSVAVVMVPFPAQGHLNQLLQLSRLLTDHGLPVYYVGSATHNRQAMTRVHGWDLDTAPNIHFHDLPLPPFSTPPPDPLAPIKFPHHLQPAFDATEQLREPFGALLKSLCDANRNVVIIHDSLMSFAAQESTKYANAEAFVFHSISAFAQVFFEWEAVVGKIDKEVNIPDLPPLSFEGCFTTRFVEFIQRQLPLMAACSGRIYNTCPAVEGDFLGMLAHLWNLGGKNMWAIGPMNPIVLSYDSKGKSHSRHKCLDWLDRQPDKSVIYVSFGTNTAISDEQILELAMGLERSEQRFIWVLRDADRGDIFTKEEHAEKKKISPTSPLPKDYEKKMGRKGVIVRDWAPQLDILAHPSTGGFLSHCGWNSCTESMSMGVPIAAWPMHSDQPRNAMLVTHVLRNGIAAREWTRRDEIASAAVVEAAVRRLMVSEEGKEIRKRAEELGRVIREAWLEGGCSHAELHSFIAHIKRER